MRSFFVTITGLFRSRFGSAVSLSPSLKNPPSLGSIAVVGLVANREDRQLLDQICKGNRWRLLFAETCQEAKSALDTLKASVILYDRDLSVKGWRATVQELAASPTRACVILVSTVLDTYLREEVLRIGGYDVLCKPLHEADVVRAIRLASWYWYSGARALSDLIQES